MTTPSLLDDLAAMAAAYPAPAATVHVERHVLIEPGDHDERHRASGGATLLDLGGVVNLYGCIDLNPEQARTVGQWLLDFADRRRS